jgi:hypothetical protein
MESEVDNAYIRGSIRKLMGEGFLSKDELRHALNISNQHYGRILHGQVALHPTRRALLGYIMGDVTGKTDRKLAPAPAQREPVKCKNDRHIFWKWMARTGLRDANEAAEILFLTTSRVHDFTSWSKAGTPLHVSRLMAYVELDITGTINSDFSRFRWSHQMPLRF